MSGTQEDGRSLRQHIQYQYERNWGNTSDHHWDQLSWSPVAFVYEERPPKLDNYTYKEMNNVRLP